MRTGKQTRKTVSAKFFILKRTVVYEGYDEWPSYQDEGEWSPMSSPFVCLDLLHGKGVERNAIVAEYSISEVQVHPYIVVASSIIRSQPKRVAGNREGAVLCYFPSQLHSVVDIGALGDENSSARGKQRRNWATLNHVFVRFVMELRGQSSSTPVETIRNPIGVWSRFLFCGQAFIKFNSVEFWTYVVRSLVNIPQDSSMAMVPLAIDTRIKNRTPIFT